MKDTKQSVQDQFSKVAANYRTSQVHAQGPDLKFIVDLLEDRTIEHALDAGCGAGHAAATVAPHVGQVTALDFTANMLDQVRLLAEERGLDNLATQQGDVENLPFEDGTFDLVVTRYSAHHWVNPGKGIRECHRVLKPGGMMLLSDVVGHDDPTQDTFLQTIDLLRDLSHVRDHSVAQWLQMFESAGFESTPVFEWQQFIDFESWVARMATPQSQIDMIKTVFDHAAGSVRQVFNLQDNYDFDFTCAVIQGIKT